MPVLRLVVLGVSATLAVAAPALAQNAYERSKKQVESRLVLSEAFLRQRGMTASHNYHYDVIRGGRSDSYTLTLRKGTTYGIVGACDNDCRDLDLEVLDDNGNVVERDDKDDPNPIVAVRPRWTAKFTIQLSMEGCRTRDCVVGIGVFSD